MDSVTIYSDCKLRRMTGQGRLVRAMSITDKEALAQLGEQPTFLRLPRKRRGALPAAVHGQSLLLQALPREQNTSTSAAHADDFYLGWHAAPGFGESSQSAPRLTVMDGSALRKHGRTSLSVLAPFPVGAPLLQLETIGCESLAEPRDNLHV